MHQQKLKRESVVVNSFAYLGLALGLAIFLGLVAINVLLLNKALWFFILATVIFMVGSRAARRASSAASSATRSASSTGARSWRKTGTPSSPARPHPAGLSEPSSYFASRRNTGCRGASSAHTSSVDAAVASKYGLVIAFSATY